jgi:hypothetical protein
MVHTLIYSIKFIEANINKSAEIFATRLYIDSEIVKMSFAE